MRYLTTLKSIAFLLLGLVCLHPALPAPVALIAGIAFSLSFGNPFPVPTRYWSVRLLEAAIVAIGAGMRLDEIVAAGLHGIGYTALSIILVFALGLWLGRLLAVEAETALLIAGGTAICGGSAIAVLALTVRARVDQVSVALAAVFALNALAIVAFPLIGHSLGMSETQFGFWCALAIHDTSTVVGAAMPYGEKALQIATTVKLARAAWILPMAAFVAAMGKIQATRRASHVATEKPRRPWFILVFILVSALATWVPSLSQAAHLTSEIGKHILILSLFLIGASMTRSGLRQVGGRPFLQAGILWSILATTTLAVILRLHAVGS